MPLSLGWGDVVSPVVLCFSTRAADAGVISATEQLENSQVGGAERGIGGGVRGTAQGVPSWR